MHPLDGSCSPVFIESLCGVLFVFVVSLKDGCSSDTDLHAANFRENLADKAHNQVGSGDAVEGICNNTVTAALL